ncbi:hypothetical protein [Bdellovibrio sp. HCB2-146]|uniref:hypothetical protein n=1 Tax=Bdellovibrio sp. HCB2-146 TaxID=3394362 RepID=UPI0039BC879E
MKLISSLLLGALLIFSSASFAKKSPMNLEISSDVLSSQGNKYYSYHFGQVRVNWSEWADLYLRNTGNGPLYVQGVYLHGSSAFRAWSNCPAYLYPGQSCLTRVEFRPWYEGYDTARLRFALADGNIYVDLGGWGVRY